MNKKDRALWCSLVKPPLPTSAFEKEWVSRNNVSCVLDTSYTPDKLLSAAKHAVANGGATFESCRQQAQQFQDVLGRNYKVLKSQQRISKAEMANYIMPAVNKLSKGQTVYRGIGTGIVGFDRHSAVVSVLTGYRLPSEGVAAAILVIQNVHTTTLTKLRSHKQCDRAKDAIVTASPVTSISVDAIIHECSCVIYACYDSSTQTCEAFERDIPSRRLTQARIDLQHIRFARCVLYTLLTKRSATESLTPLQSRLVTLHVPAPPASKKRGKRKFSRTAEGSQCSPLSKVVITICCPLVIIVQKTSTLHG